MKRETAEKVFTNWTVKEILGQGAFGKVYRIEREEFGSVYQAAMKKISIPQTNEEVGDALSEGMSENDVTGYFKSFVEEIVTEFKLMSQLKGHTNIVSYEDHLVIPHEDGIGWDILIRMELLKSLKTLTAERNLTEAEVIRLGIDMCNALEVCGKMDIIHRDIKPENIFISSLGDFKLGDFGIARTAEKTMSNLSKKGTYTYMAPEVYRGNAYNATVDIYSLGIVMYRFMNYNRAPFLPLYPKPISFSDREESFTRRISGEHMPAPACGSKELKQIILKACAFQPSARYQTPAQFRSALQNLLQSAASSQRMDDAMANHAIAEDDFEEITADEEPFDVKNSAATKKSKEQEIKYAKSESEEFEEDDATVSIFGTRADDFPKEASLDQQQPASAQNSYQAAKAVEKPKKKKGCLGTALIGIGVLAVLAIAAIGFIEPHYILYILDYIFMSRSATLIISIAITVLIWVVVQKKRKKKK